MNNDPLDVVAFLVALLTFVTSKEIAYLLGPYAAIFVLASAGAALSLSSTDKVMTPVRATIYVSIRVLVAFVLTAAIAELLQNVIPWAKPRYTLVPIAFGIGWIKDYDSVRKWVAEMIQKWTNKGIDNAK